MVQHHYCTCLEIREGGEIAFNREREREYKETKVKAAVKLFQNRDPVMKMVRDIEKRAEKVGHPVTDKGSGEVRGGVRPATKAPIP